MEKKIFVAEDKYEINSLVKIYLTQNESTLCTSMDVRETLAIIKGRKLDLNIVDIVMQEMNRMENNSELCENKRSVTIRIIYLSNLMDNESNISWLEFGVVDYVKEPFDLNVLIARINARLRPMKDKLSNVYEHFHLNDLYEKLTYQETKVIKLMEKGYTNKEIALKLSLTVGTVKVYNHNIYQKLQVKNRTEAIVRAKEMQIM